MMKLGEKLGVLIHLERLLVGESMESKSHNLNTRGDIDKRIRETFSNKKVMKNQS